MTRKRIDVRHASNRNHTRQYRERFAIVGAVMFQVTMLQRAVHMQLVVGSATRSD